MWGKVISVPDILKEEQLNILNSFQNEHYLEEPEMIELKIPFSKKAYQMPMSSLLSFIGLSEKHIIQAIEYFKKEIFEKYPWLEDIVSLGLQEIFYDIQAAVIKKMPNIMPIITNSIPIVLLCTVMFPTLFYN